MPDDLDGWRRQMRSRSGRSQFPEPPRVKPTDNGMEPPQGERLPPPKRLPALPEKPGPFRSRILDARKNHTEGRTMK